MRALKPRPTLFSMIYNFSHLTPANKKYPPSKAVFIVFKHILGYNVTEISETEAMQSIFDHCDRKDFYFEILGNKDSITDIIKDIILDKVDIQADTVLFDAFCGTGSVANAFKDICDIVINDNFHCATTYAFGRMVAASCTFERLGFNPFDFFNGSDTIVESYFYNTYSPGGSARMYLSEHNAGRVDYFRQTIEAWFVEGKLTEREYRYLLACLIESVSFVSNTAGVYGAFLKKWDDRALKDIQFIDLSDGIKATHQIRVSTDKIENIIEAVQCDILYLDPPYTQNQYGTQYHLLETLILDDKPEKVSKVTGSRSTREMRSDWSKIYKVHILLDRVFVKTNARHVFLVITMPEI